MHLAIIRIHGLSHPLPNLMIPSLVPHIVLEISLTNASAQDPVQDTPRTEVTFSRVNQMLFVSTSNAAQEEARRHEGISGVGEGLFNRDNGDVDEVGEHVEAEEHGWKIGWNKLVREVNERVVIVRGEREG